MPWTGSAEAQLASGLVRISSEHSFDVDAQVIEIKKLASALLDPRLRQENDAHALAYLAQSDAIILNIDYPLGLGAYNILTEIAEQVGQVLGVYVLGKAAS